MTQNGTTLDVRMKLAQADVDTGCAGDGGRCPAARALARWSELEGPGEPTLACMAHGVILEVGPRQWTAEIDDCTELWRWIEKFDEGAAVGPGEFSFTMQENPDFKAADAVTAGQRTAETPRRYPAIEYPAEVERGEDGRYVVTFADFGWGATDGATREEALAEARDLLRELIAATMRDGGDLPEPSLAAGDQAQVAPRYRFD